MPVDDGIKLSKVSCRLFLLRHPSLFPSLVDPLQVVVTHLDVRQVVYTNSSPLYTVDCAEAADNVCDLSSCLHREPFLFVWFFCRRNLSFDLRVHDIHDVSCDLGLQWSRNSFEYCPIRILRHPKIASKPHGRSLKIHSAT